MIIVTFEIIIKKGQSDNYLEQAKTLLPLVEKIKGFISVERFRSVSNPDKIISVSKWESIDAINEWKSNHQHQKAQDKGKSHIFEDYVISVSETMYQYDMLRTEETTWE